MSRAEFLAINETRSKLGQKLLANPRNAAAGAVRKKDPAETAKRGLRFFAYATGELRQALAPYQSELVAELSRLGFVTNPLLATFDTLEGLISHFANIQLLPHSLEYDIDVVVLQVASIDDHANIGNIPRHPRSASTNTFPSNTE